MAEDGREPHPTLTFSDVALRPSSRSPVLLDGLTFQATTGSMVCLVGRSGTGKSTVARAATGFLEPVRGQVRWVGASVADLGPAARDAWRADHLGYLDQEAGMLHELTLGENALLRARATQVEDAPGRLATLAGQLGIASVLHRFPDQVSVGQRQRAGLARALVTAPSLLVLDEPTAALDEHDAHLVLDVLARARADGAAVVVTSHDPLVWEAATHSVRLHPILEPPSAPA